MIIGITGMPTVGKDTFFKMFTEWVTKETNYNCGPYRVSFADAIRTDLQHFVNKHYDIDIMKCTGAEKEIIRPLMIAHGFAMRQIEPNYWIDKTVPTIKELLDKKLTPVFTDVRYLNEIKLIQKSGGIVIHLTREPKVPFPKPDSKELIKGFEKCDLTIELYNVDMNLLGDVRFDIVSEYISKHKKHFQNIIDTLRVSQASNK